MTSCILASIASGFWSFFLSDPAWKKDIFLLHFYLGLGTALIILLVHCLIFTYFLGTGRWVKEVGIAYKLPDGDLPKTTRELKRSTFPPALFSMLIAIAACAAGAGVQLQHWPWPVHFTTALSPLRSTSGPSASNTAASPRTPASFRLFSWKWIGCAVKQDWNRMKKRWTRRGDGQVNARNRKRASTTLGCTSRPLTGCESALGRLESSWGSITDSPIMLAKILLPLALALPAQVSTDQAKPNPLAPSLPQVTEEEQARFEAVIDELHPVRHRQASWGRGARKALEDFNALPPHAVFALIDGFNRTANFEATCPAVIIGKKIQAPLECQRRP